MLYHARVDAGSGQRTSAHAHMHCATAAAVRQRDERAPCAGDCPSLCSGSHCRVSDGHSSPKLATRSYSSGAARRHCWYLAFTCSTCTCHAHHSARRSTHAHMRMHWRPTEACSAASVSSSASPSPAAAAAAAPAAAPRLRPPPRRVRRALLELSAALSSLSLELLAPSLPLRRRDGRTGRCWRGGRPRRFISAHQKAENGSSLPTQNNSPPPN